MRAGGDARKFQQACISDVFDHCIRTEENHTDIGVRLSSLLMWLDVSDRVANFLKHGPNTDCGIRNPGAQDSQDLGTATEDVDDDLLMFDLFSQEDKESEAEDRTEAAVPDFINPAIRLILSDTHFDAQLISDGQLILHILSHPCFDTDVVNAAIQKTCELTSRSAVANPPQTSQSRSLLTYFCLSACSNIFIRHAINAMSDRVKSEEINTTMARVLQATRKFGTLLPQNFDPQRADAAAENTSDELDFSCIKFEQWRDAIWANGKVCKEAVQILEALQDTVKQAQKTTSTPAQDELVTNVGALHRELDKVVQNVLSSVGHCLAKMLDRSSREVATELENVKRVDQAKLQRSIVASTWQLIKEVTDLCVKMPGDAAVRANTQQFAEWGQLAVTCLTYIMHFVTKPVPAADPTVGAHLSMLENFSSCHSNLNISEETLLTRLQCAKEALDNLNTMWKNHMAAERELIVKQFLESMFPEVCRVSADQLDEANVSLLPQ